MKLILLVLVCILGYSHAHMRWVCPRPESDNTGIKSGPCSSQDINFEDEYTDITPGPLTLRFEESIVHENAPTLIRLHKMGDNETSCILLDHIPHNNGAKMNLGDDCWLDGYPIGNCAAQYYTTVNIPDIECDQCYIQLISVMLDKYTPEEAPCVQFDQGYNNCSTYYTCAMVKIRPTSAGKGKGIETCTDMKENWSGAWPYRPVDDYQVTVNSIASPLQYDSYTKALTYSVTGPGAGVRINFGAEVYFEADGLSGSWDDMTPEQWMNLRMGRLTFIVVDSGDNTVAQSPIVLVEKHYDPYVYYHLGNLDWTPQGWLKGNYFVGADAVYPYVNQPVGKCIPKTDYYGATNQDLALSVTVTEDRGYIRGAFSSEEQLIGITFKDTTGQVPDYVVPSSAFKNNMVNAVLNMTVQAKAANFSNQVEVTTSGGTFNLALTQALVSGLYFGREYQGEAVMYLGEHGKVDYTVVVANPEGMVLGMSLNGPARTMLAGDVLYTLSSSSDNTASGTIMDVPASTLHAIWSGQVYVDVQTDRTSGQDRGINGQVPVPAASICTNTNICYTTELSVLGEGTDLGAEVLNTNGAATFVINAEGNVEYSITVADLKPDEMITRVQITSPPTVLASLELPAPSELEDKTVVVNGVVANPSPNLIAAIQGGDAVVEIASSRFTDGILGRIPIMSQRP